MAYRGNKTAGYKIIADSGGSRYRFFCYVSGMVLCTTQPVRADTLEKELTLAWEGEGKAHFNRCKKCGRWICDVMYNADTGECVDCSVWEERPNYCAHCGEPITAKEVYCTECGARLRYGEAVTA